MADTTHLPKTGEFDRAEWDELRDLAGRLASFRPDLKAEISGLCTDGDAGLAGASHPADGEACAETFARNLRSLWLTAAGEEAASVYRSPTEGEARHIARHHDAFGYERDLQPESLEARCRDFYPPPPAGWRQDHVLFSSGQSAMTAALLALGSRLACESVLRLAHRGAYFETRSLIRLLPFVHQAAFPHTADVVVDEPVCCDGQFHTIDTSKLLAASPKAVVFDTTLLGRDDGIDGYLTALPGSSCQIVLRVVSCHKLLQGGLELANVGIVSVYARQDAAKQFGEALRKVRTLIGGGLNYVDNIALEAPWVLDAAYADRYVGAIFEHNGRLARAVDEANARFAPISHPALAGGAAPYCVFQLREASPKAYDALEREIAMQSAQRRLVLAHGGSFGFRGHRYEVVRPETGEPPFLRIALGRRGGWSCDGVIEMMKEMAAG